MTTTTLSRLSFASASQRILNGEGVSLLVDGICWRVERMGAGYAVAVSPHNGCSRRFEVSASTLFCAAR